VYICIFNFRGDRPNIKFRCERQNSSVFIVHDQFEIIIAKVGVSGAVKIFENVHSEFVPRHIDVEVEVEGAPRRRGRPVLDPNVRRHSKRKQHF